jgi:tetratricopeptide (TPR) repeat protein
MPPSDQGFLSTGHSYDLEQLTHSGQADARAVIDLRGGQGVAIGDHNTVSFTQVLRGPGRVAGSAYLDQVRDIAPDPLRDRGEELAALARACSTPDLYNWWRADPWVGKSALMATFVLNPPPGVDVVSFFVTARFSGQAHSAVFTEALLEQLAWMTGEDLPASPVPEVRAAHRAQLLRLAAERSHAQGRRLVLVIDGLDEDTSRRPGLSLPSIASLLPSRPSLGLKVLVASRPSPELPDDVPEDHAIRHCSTYDLTPSPYALDIGRLAKEEIRRLLEDPQQREILGLIAVSGGLTLPDIQALMQASPFEIARHLDGPMGRTVHLRNLDSAADSANAPYVMAHDTLRVQTVSTLGESKLAEYRDRIYQWADSYRAQGWPQDTPVFLIEGYAEMLNRTPNSRKLASLAVDHVRHDMIRARTGSDVAGLHEVSIGQSLLLNELHPDLGAMLQLAAHRDYLNARNARIPADLPVAWVRLGDSGRALALASMIENDDLHTRAMTALSLAFEDVNEADNAIQSAGAIRQPKARLSALIDVVEREYARPDGERNLRLVENAMNLAGSLPSRHEQDVALTKLVSAVLQAGECDLALRCAQAIVSFPKQASARLKVAEALISHDAERARALIAETEAACDLIENPADRARVMCEVVTALRGAGQRNEARLMADRAIVTARRIEPELHRHLFLNSLAGEFVALGDFRQALALSGEPLSFASPNRSDLSVLRTSVEALCQDGRASEAVALIEELTDDYKRFHAELALAESLQAAGIEDLAVEATRNVRDRLPRIEVTEDKLTAITDVIRASLGARLDMDAEPYVRQFLAEVEQITWQASRDFHLRCVGQILLDADELQWAQRVFEKLAADDKLDSLLELLPRLLAAGSMEEAAVVMTQCLTLADDCSTLAEAAEARVRVLAAAADRCDSSLTMAMVANIQSLIQHVDDLEAYARLLTSLIPPVADLLPQADVLRMVRDVESTAEMIPQQDPRASVLAGLTNTLLNAGLRVRARQTATLAESAAQVDPAADIRIGDVEDLVDTLCGLGDLQRAAVVAEQFPDRRVRQRVLAKIAVWHTAFNPDPASEEVHARGNVDPYLQSLGLVDAAWGFVKADRLRDAQRLCADAERQSRYVKTTYYRLGLWIGLAGVFLGMGDSSSSQRLAEEVIEHLSEVPSAPSRALVMAKLVSLLVRMGRQTDAEEWSFRSEDLARSVTRPSTQAHVLCEIAVSVALWDQGRARRLLTQALAVGPWSVSLTGMSVLDPDALREVVDSGFQFVPPLRISGKAVAAYGPPGSSGPDSS